MRKHRALVLIAFLALNAIMCACPLTGPRKEDTPIAQPTATVVTPGAKESTVERPGPTPTQVGRATVEPGGGEITVEQRTKALDDLASFHESLPGEDPEADRQALVDYMTSRPEFEAAGIVDGGSVWGRFADGRLVIFANKPRPSATAEAKGTAASPIASRQAVPVLFSSRLGHPGRAGDQALDASNQVRIR
jgi:hypothetical protein